MSRLAFANMNTLLKPQEYWCWILLQKTAVGCKSSLFWPLGLKMVSLAFCLHEQLEAVCIVACVKASRLAQGAKQTKDRKDTAA